MKSYIIYGWIWAFHINHNMATLRFKEKCFPNIHNHSLPTLKDKKRERQSSTRGSRSRFHLFFSTVLITRTKYRSIKFQSISRNGKIACCCYCIVLYLCLNLLRRSCQSLEQIPPKQLHLFNHTFNEEMRKNKFRTFNHDLLPFDFIEQYEPKMIDNTDNFESEECKPMGQWQLESLPNCNVVHEFRGSERQLISSGSYRETWLILENDVAFAMKTLVFQDSVSARNLDRHRRDAVIMSKLTSSIHIPNIYAHCK